MNKTNDFESNIQNILAKQNFNQHLFLKFDDCIIRVETTTLALKQKLEEYLGPFIFSKDLETNITVKVIETRPFVPDIPFINKPPDPGKKKIKEQYCDLDSGRVVRKKQTGTLFYFNRGENLALGPCSENDNQIINFINNRFIQWKLDQGCLLCHAAAVARNNFGIILAGFSGMGKSTLALHLMNKGLTFISNDRLMVNEDGSKLIMYGVPKLPRVNPGTILNNPTLTGILEKHELEKFKRVKDDKMWNLECKYDVFLDQCFGPGRFRLKSGAKSLVILNWRHEKRPLSFKPVDLKQRIDLLNTVIKAPGLFYLPERSDQHAPASPGDYIDLFALCEVFELSGGINFQQASEKCLELIS